LQTLPHTGADVPQGQTKAASKSIIHPLTDNPAPRLKGHQIQLNSRTGDSSHKANAAYPWQVQEQALVTINLGAVASSVGLSLQRPSNHRKSGSAGVGVQRIRARDWRWERLESLPGWGSKPHYALNRAPSLPVSCRGVYVLSQKTFHALPWSSYSVFSRGHRLETSPQL